MSNAREMIFPGSWKNDPGQLGKINHDSENADDIMFLGRITIFRAFEEATRIPAEGICQGKNYFPEVNLKNRSASKGKN